MAKVEVATIELYRLKVNSINYTVVGNFPTEAYFQDTIKFYSTYSYTPYTTAYVVFFRQKIIMFVIISWLYLLCWIFFLIRIFRKNNHPYRQNAAVNNIRPALHITPFNHIFPRRYVYKHSL